MDDGIGLEDILIEHDDIILHEQLGSAPGRFGSPKVEIILILIGNLDLGRIYVQPY